MEQSIDPHYRSQRTRSVLGEASLQTPPESFPAIFRKRYHDSSGSCRHYIFSLLCRHCHHFFAFCRYIPVPDSYWYRSLLSRSRRRRGSCDCDKWENLRLAIQDDATSVGGERNWEYREAEKSQNWQREFPYRICSFANTTYLGVVVRCLCHRLRMESAVQDEYCSATYIAIHQYVVKFTLMKMFCDDQIFPVGFSMVAMMTNVQSLLVDLFPTQGSSVTAAVRKSVSILSPINWPSIEQSREVLDGSRNRVCDKLGHKCFKARMDIYADRWNLSRHLAVSAYRASHGSQVEKGKSWEEPRTLWDALRETVCWIWGLRRAY